MERSSHAEPDAPLGSTRREFLKTGAVAAGVTAAHALGTRPAAAEPPAGEGPEDLLRPDRRRRVLISGGTVVSMDPEVGDFVEGDVLIEGKKIAAVGPDLRGAAGDGKARVIDARDMIVIPGFVDCHLHSWEGQIRGLIPSGTIADYSATTHQGFGPFYRPEDMYAGNLMTAMVCIDAGITCILDNSHNSRTAEHSDAAIEALFDSGIRAVHASGAPQFGEWDRQWPQDLLRLRDRYFASEDQLVTLRMFSGLVRENWEFAKQHDFWITTEFGGSPANDALLREFYDAGLLDDRHTFNHVGNVGDEAWELIRQVGATVNVTPRSDPQYLIGGGIPGTQAALDHGVRPGISNDNETSYAADMFTEMRVLFYFQRGIARNRALLGDPSPPAPITVRDCLEFATLRGAANCALIDRIGSLTPGKEADIVLIRKDAINTVPFANAVGAVVSFANVGNVDTVLIAGQVRKWRGRLVGVPERRARRLAEESREFLFAQRGFELDVLA